MRIKGLDFLRGIAILLVLFRHNTLGDNFLYHFGWLGVDLFFVLSGFLVSGLLFTEYKKRNSVRIGRFLIRRGFKIYPPFYFFILVTLTFQWFHTNTLPSIDSLLPELLYVQSYFPGIWLHTWSLAVEEHFYILLSILIFFAVKFKKLNHSSRIITFLLLLLLISFFLRFSLSYPHRNESSFGFVQSHLRADGIIIGVLVSYLYHFTSFVRFFSRNRYLFLIFAVALIVPAFIFKGGSFFMNTWGLSIVNIAFGIFTLWAVNTRVFSYRWNSALSSIVSFIGVHSYSIYLWHIFLLQFIEKIFSPPSVLSTLSFIAFSVLVGSFFSFTVEKPFLRLRNRLVQS